MTISNIKPINSFILIVERIYINVTPSDSTKKCKISKHYKTKNQDIERTHPTAVLIETQSL